jgi:hypothetical protein
VDETSYGFGGGTDEVRCFLDDDYSAVMTKVISAGTDPVELLPDEARRLASALIALADRFDQQDAGGEK